MRINLDPFINQINHMDITIPVPLVKPLDLSSLTLLDSVVGNTYKTITIKKSGWYNVKVCAGTGGNGANGNGKAGGCISDAVVYLFKDSRVLMWGCTNGTGTTTKGLTGYPVPTGSAPNAYSHGVSGLLGGSGATGIEESGGGGGGAGGNGGFKHVDAGTGGGGGGFIAGVNTITSLSEEFTLGNYFSVKTVLAMVLCGGGGGGVGDNGGTRATGGGGGAWGSGGGCYSGRLGGTGPGTGDPNYVSGEYGSHYNGGGRGAWCLRDFTTNTILSGIGTKTGSSGTPGTTQLNWIDNQIEEPSFFWDLGTIVNGSNVNELDNGSIIDSVSLIKDMGTLVL